MPDRVVQGIEAVQKTLRQWSGAGPVSAVFLSPQKRQYCADEIGPRSVGGVDFDVLPDIADVEKQGRHYDLCILGCHNEGEESILMNLRDRDVAKLYAVWLWDNHHHQFVSFRTAMLADIVFPG